MLDGLRSLAKTWPGKILGAFLIVGLAGFGISNVLLDLGSNKVATVGNQDITMRAFQRAYNDSLNQFARQIGRLPTSEEALAFGIPSTVLTRLGAEAALNQLGETIGMGVSDARLSRMLREEPSFAGILGKFEPQNFQAVLQANGFTEAEYFELQRKAAIRQQVAQGLFIGAPVPAAAVELINRYNGDTRTLDYFVLSSQNTLPVEPPTEEQLIAYLKDHQTGYRTRETRTADILALTPDAIAATKTITDAEIAAEYERTKAQRIKIEKRTIEQVPLVTPAAEQAFEDGKAAGKTFAVLAAENGLKPSVVGTLARADITDASLAEAAYGLAVGDFAVIPGIGGKRAISVTAIQAGGQITLDEVKDEIRKNLALTQARSEYTDVLDQIEELRAAFQPLPDIAARFNLPLTEVKLTASGAELTAVPAIPATEYGKVATAVFAAADEKLSPTVAISANNNVWFDLKGTEVARDQTIEEVRDALVTAWTDEKTEEAIVVETGKAVAAIKGGRSIADVGADLNQFSVLSQPLKRTGDGTTVLNAAVAEAAFGGGEGFVGTAVNADGDHVVFQVVEITPLAGEGLPNAEQAVASTRQNTLYSDFMGGLRDSTGMTINQKALSQLLALDTSTGN